MKSTLLKAGLALSMAAVSFANAQEFPIDNMNPRDQRAVNMFENKKDSISNFDGLKVRVGGAFALQFQALQHESKADQNVPATKLYDIGNNFNLATANLDIDVALYDGVNLHLRTFLSSRHHPEPYVKGGYLQIDKLDFIKKDFLKDVMKYSTLKFGHDEINYGDAHFRRTDNAYAIKNPFVGNLLMDSYATFVFAEAYYQRDGFLGMVGVSNGKLNQDATSGGSSPSVYAKLGYDKQVNDDLRVRLTGSVYNSAHSKSIYLYDGDRAGSRYYFVMENAAATSKGNFLSGAVVPDFKNKTTSFMVNPFVRYKGLEFFGTYENASGRNFSETDRRSYNQYAAELLYRFGADENIYIGGKYNQVKGELISGNDIKVDRFNIGGGWFMTKNILAKAEYVNQKYDGYASTSILNGGKFNGFVLEAVIAF